MRLFFVCVALTVVSTHSPAASLSLADGRITCDLADRLLPVPEEQLANMQLKPLAAFSTVSRDARITVTRAGYAVPMNMSDLPEVKHVMDHGFAKIWPLPTWHADEIVGVNGRNWIHFDFTSEIGGKQIRSALYVTSFDGDQLQFLLQADGSSGAQSWPALETCSQTLQIK